MLDATLKQTLSATLERLQRPVHLAAALDASPAAAEMRALLADIAEASPRVQITEGGPDQRQPSFAISDAAGHQAGLPPRVRFAGLPLGHEFTSLVLALLWAGGHPPKIEPAMIEQIRALDADLHFEVYMSLSCHNCPDVVQAVALMATLNPRIRATVIDGALFQHEVNTREIMAVPSVFLNGQPFASGRMSLQEIVARLDVDAEAREARALDARATFDVLVIGGGPAGAAAAVYAARKGVRVGLVAERLGGQVNDTLAIENYIASVTTDGPRLAADLEAHVRAYPVDVISGVRTQGLVPAGAEGLHTVHLSNGATLRARSVIVATGARWRNLGVPGEAALRNRGVAYCPHCDGPLFKGQRVAVVGGGNSGVEAAIDLAGITRHVTLIEYAYALKADAVLIERLRSLPNVDIRLGSQALEITGASGRVDGLRLRDRQNDRESTIALEGVFVQIGLVPNTEWLKGVVEMNRFGEIVTDAKGRTNVPGIVAAGDCTVVPYKQIVVAAGEGAKAALAAFDHLVRLPTGAAAEAGA